MKCLTIEVADWKFVSDGNTTYIDYQVSGEDEQGPFLVRRRYSDFDLLRNALVSRWLAVYIPPIAHKRIAGNKEDAFIEARMRALEYFCREVAKRHYLFYDPIFQKFIRASSFAAEVRVLESGNLLHMAEIYQKTFNNLPQAEAITQLPASTQFLAYSIKKLEKIRDQFRGISIAKKNYDIEFKNCFAVVLPNYERNFLTNYIESNPKSLILAKDGTVHQQLEALNAITANCAEEDYTEAVESEMRQVKALQQAMATRFSALELRLSYIRARDKALHEINIINSGKSSWRGILSGKDKQTQKLNHEATVLRADQGEKALDQMIALMPGIIYKEVEEFKKSRLLAYSTVLADVTQRQLREQKAYESLLKTLLGNLNQQ